MMDKVTLLFYDSEGRFLSADQIRAISNNGQAGYDNDALVDPVSLCVIENLPLVEEAGHFTFKISGQPVGLALNWPTETLGYSLMILDNQGKGFIKPATVNFTYQAAVDLRKKLDTAREARPDYPASQAFLADYHQAARQIELAEASDAESVKGQCGQRALEYLTRAYDQMLAEYGTVLARKTKKAFPPWLGFTLDRLENFARDCDLALEIAHPYAWVRIVFDLGQAPDHYSTIIQYARSIGLKVLGQPVDSFYDRRLTKAAYLQLFKDYIRAFPEVDAWEIGNEVNGNWLSEDIAARILETAAYVHQVAGKMTVLTLFWQINTTDPSHALFNWVEDHLPKEARGLFDVVLLSVYLEQAPMGAVFDQVMHGLHAAFPEQKTGIGELGYWVPEQRFWWAYHQHEPEKIAKYRVCEQFYRASLGYLESIGGIFWWFFQTEFPEDPAMQNIIREIVQELEGSESSRG